jgi:hypothetical protein
MGREVLIAQIFWRKVNEYRTKLSSTSLKVWLNKAIELTLNAWALATSGTDLQAPLKYDDFIFQAMADLDGDGIYAEKQTIHSAAMLYGKLGKKCKNTWNAPAVKQVIELLSDQYKARDTGEW